MNSPSPRSAAGLLGLDPVAAGTVCCIISALGYSATSICMRHLAQRDDPGQAIWAVFNKELVTVVVVGPWLLLRTLRGLPNFPSRRVLMALIGVGLAVQLVANVGVQWAFGQVGLAVTIPAVFGVMLTASAALGFAFLGERVSLRCAAVIGLLLLSLVLLGLAAAEAEKLRLAAGQPDMSTTVSAPLVVALGIAAACVAGAIYAVLTITIRHATGGPTPISTIVFVTTLMGVLTLGPLSISLLGTEKLLSTPPEDFAWMYAAGTLNLIAFLAISKGLELTTVVHANLLNASQIAMAAVAGVVFFSEQPTLWLILGVGLTIVGVSIIDRPNHGDRDADRHA